MASSSTAEQGAPEGEEAKGPPAPKAVAVKALGVKSGQRLLFMEYLVRVSSACETLSTGESPSYTRLRR